VPAEPARMTAESPPRPGAWQRGLDRLSIGLLRNLHIGGKLTVGFGILVGLTLLVVGLNYIGSVKAVTNINRTTDLRAPSAVASAKAQADLLRMLGEVRGYLALGDEAYRESYEKSSADFDADLAELQSLLIKNGNTPDNLRSQDVDRNVQELKVTLEAWKKLPAALFDLRNDQLRREPALKFLIVDATPLIASVVVSINAMIFTQQRRDPMPANMTLLADMASFQSSFYAMVAGLRGYVTTRRDTFKYEYASNLTINNTAYANLSRKMTMLEPSQQAKLGKLGKDRDAFLKLPDQMFQAVEGEHAREDLFLFRTEAVPLAERMLKLLDSIADGEQSMLQSDLTAGRDQLVATQTAALVGGGAAVVFGLLLGILFRENIAGPVRRLTGIADRIRGGDLAARAPVESGDEIGDLAATFNKMTLQLGESLADLEARRQEQEELARRFRRQSEYLGALHTTALGLISRLDLAELLADLTARAGQLLGTEHGYVYLVDATGEALERMVGVGVYATSIGQKLQANEGVAGRVWQSGEALVINDYERWEGRPAAAAALDVTIRSCMGVPLKSGSGVVGVLGMAYDVDSALQFGQEEVDLLTRFAQLASISLDTARLYTAAQEASKRIGEQNRMLEGLSNQLSKYLSPQVYASIFTGKQSVGISSRRRKLTIFFSDIADFTATTDKLESEELTELLNHYLTEMSKIALEHGATIDKYVGDAILIFFGDPETRGVREDALACVRMAIAMQRRMRELQSLWRDRGIERPFQLRIGVNTGFCTVGNFGSEDRMDYTIIGGEVNLASRLQSQAELGGILIAHETYSLVKEEIEAEELAPIAVKGFVEPIRTYRVLGIHAADATGASVLRRQGPGFKLDLDLAAPAADRAGAVAALEEMLGRLKSGGV
jgi:class 3 adenylate cyclase/CHASE3 domain sensor protein